MDQIKDLVLEIGQREPLGNRIFMEKPHTTWDNYFSGDNIFDWIGQNGFGCMMTCRRDSLPKQLPSHNLHKQKTDVNCRSRVARFNHPIVIHKATMGGAGKIFDRVHVSFQSTSSCNIATVNALNECRAYVKRKERGIGPNKRHWGIEMNNTRAFYLSTYHKLDVLDHLIANCRLYYRSWKYWYSPMLHGLAMAVVVAYDCYAEVA